MLNNIEMDAMAQNLITIPSGYKLAHTELVKHDGVPVHWLRYVKNTTGDNNFGGEHLSMTIAKDGGHLMGVMHLEKGFASDEYVTEEHAKQIAFNFLNKYAPDLLEAIEVRWVRPTRKIPLSPPHDTGFELNDGTVVTGMRVKLWANNTQKYAWVIINNTGEVISFERDIVWNTTKHCRTTERWLHDDWVQDKVAERV